jgi:glycosyltransferase involved in cell wall biosynthesis
LKILQICAAYKPAYVYGGPTMSVSMLSEQLVKASIDVEVYTTTANGKTELDILPNSTLKTDGVTTTYFKRLTKDHSHFSPALLTSLWKNIKKFDLVHIHAWWNLVSLFSATIAIIKGVPLIISPRGTLSSYSFQNKNIGPKWAIHTFWGKVLLNKSYFHVTSELEKKAISSFLNPLSICLLPNFVKLPPFKVWENNKHSEKLRLLFFSRIEQKKGLEILINSLKNINFPYHLYIAGSGDSDYINTLKSIAININVANNITWLGFQNESKFDVLHNHDLFILPSYDENFGNAVIESLAVGTPVLISDKVGLADYVEKNDLGWICQNNVQSVLEIINEIGTNQNYKLQIIREKAPKIIYDDFLEDTLVKKYIDFYTNILQSNHN